MEKHSYILRPKKPARANHIQRNNSDIEFNRSEAIAHVPVKRTITDLIVTFGDHTKSVDPTPIRFLTLVSTRQRVNPLTLQQLENPR